MSELQPPEQNLYLRLIYDIDRYEKLKKLFRVSYLIEIQ